MDQYRVLYDDDCGFCRWSLSKILAWDTSDVLRPVALQSPEGEELLFHLSDERRMASWHLVDPDGKIWSGGAAAAPLLRRLPFGRPVAALAELFPGAVDYLYRLVARNRDVLGRMLGEQACSVDPSRLTAGGFGG